MERLTRHADEFPCRIKENCLAEEWFYKKYSEYPDYICDGCPFQAVINKLAWYEDMAEMMEDDLK